MATKSNRRIQIQSGGSGLTAPKIGGSDNYLERLMYAQSKGMMDAQMDQQKAQQTQASLPQGSFQTQAKDAMGNIFETPDARLGTADAQNQINRIKQLKQVIAGVQDLGNTLPTDAFNAFTKTMAAEKAYGRFGGEKHRAYMGALPTAAVGTYRAISGDNRLSDADAAARALPLFWDPREPEDTREGKNAFINFMMNEAEQGLTPGEPKDDMEALIRWQSFVNSSKKKFGNPLPNQEGGNTGNNNNGDESGDEEEIFNRLKGAF